MLSPTRFHVAQTAGVDWLVDRSGKPFFSNGVCCVGLGDDPKKLDPNNPSYSGLKLFPSQTAWARDTTAKLKSWGFNTVGAWSDHGLLKGSLYQTPIVHMVSEGIPWVDMWDPATVAKCDQFAQDQLSIYRGDPNVIGFFSDNELGWWYGAMFDWAWKATPKFGTRDRLVKLLQDRYTDWASFEKDFDPEGARCFADLRLSGHLYLRPGGNGMAYVRDVMAMLADRYYSLCRDAIKKVDPRALYLGDRYISDFFPEVAHAAGKYCDVVSTNLNACWADGGLYRYYLPELHRQAKKPLMVTEYYEAAMENGSGNMNDSSGFPTVQTQKERAQAAQAQFTNMADLPYVVGAHWFQFNDEARHGRGDGENYDMGLVDVSGKPYPALTKMFAQADIQARHRRAIYKGGPSTTLPKIQALPARDLLNWPRPAAYIEPGTGDVRGDLYVAWNPGGLFVGIAWDEDLFAESFYRDGRIPAQDRAKIEIRIDGVKKPIVATMGLGGGLETDGANAISHREGTRCDAVFRIPANAWHVPALRPGQTVALTATFTTRGRAYRMNWKTRRILK